MAESTIKKRSLTTSLGGWKYSEDFGNSFPEYYAPNDYTLGAQETESIGHRRLKNGAWDGGGPFSTVTVAYEFPTTPGRYLIPGAGTKFILDADLGTPIPDTLLPLEYQNMTIDKAKASQPSLDSFGTTAISRVAPTNPNAELGQALGEIVKDQRLPSIPGVSSWKNRVNALRSLGSEFLNVEFGWLPLVSDIKNTGNSVRFSRDILDQYERDSGKSVRRQFSFPIDESESSRDLGEYQPAAQPFGADGWPSKYRNPENGYGPMQLTQTIKVSSRMWFSGCFTYALPNQSDSWSGVRRNAAEADKLFGITLTPDIVWELTPWSWAIDWFSNTGDVVNNVTNFALQGLVMRYGYMMHENVIEITNQFKPNSKYWGGTFFPPSKKIISSKRRQEANPFGFGIGWEGLSPTQLAIAAAVGITHVL